MVTLFASLGKGRIATIISLLRTPINISMVMFLYEKFSGGDNIWYVLAISEFITLIVALALLNKFILIPLNIEINKDN